jgi:hypothetical protein
MKTGEYYGTHWYWDSEDREYVLCATWYFEQNYPEMPDVVSLEAIEVEEQESGSPDLEEVKWMCGKDREIWRYVEKEGPPMKLEEVDYL